MIDKVYLQQLAQDPNFTALLDYIESQRPIIPLHDAKNDNTEVWKAESARQQGFDLCFARFRKPQLTRNKETEK